MPVPRDAAGYTHERHKQNYIEMQLAGMLYQLTSDPRYVDFVRALLDRYADLYPTLGDHPAARSSSPGRLFHQSLNEAVWLVQVSRAYDCIYAALTPEQRTRYESRIFRPMAGFLSEERAREFDRIHNHGTWAAAAVGLAGYAMGDTTLVKKALGGSNMDGSAGYFRQVDQLFSPDGYYCEGPYYARYALMPFFLLAEAVARNEPGRKVYDRRDGVLVKAVDAALQQTYVNGGFLPFNDALKEKTIRSPDFVLALDFAYVRGGHDPHLLEVARRQGTVAFTAAGFEVARDLQANPHPPAYDYKSCQFTDGPDGNQGGIGLLRSGEAPDQMLAMLKYTSFGMEHGHYDKLALMVYDQGRELLPDYGAARFLNIEQKEGGRYLPENKSYARQTIAHNTVVVDERSDYDGRYTVAEKRHAEGHFFDVADPDLQVMSARDVTAVAGVTMQRTVALVRDARLAYPVLIDVFRLGAAQSHRYDYPLHYDGQFLACNVDYHANVDALHPLGDANGYQHLWVEAEGEADGAVTFTWLNGGRFYTVIAAADPETRVLFTQAGAHDPHFNLRPERALILRREAAAHTFAAVLEPHGDWDPTHEVTQGIDASVQDVRVLASTEEGSAVRITGAGGLEWTWLISNRAVPAGAHTVVTPAGTFTWNGPFALRRN